MRSFDDFLGVMFGLKDLKLIKGDELIQLTWYFVGASSIVMIFIDIDDDDDDDIYLFIR